MALVPVFREDKLLGVREPLELDLKGREGQRNPMKSKGVAYALRVEERAEDWQGGWIDP